MSDRRLIAPWLWAPLVLVVDFVTKRIVLAHADTLLQRIDFIGDLVRFAYVRNPGAAMGLFPSGRVVLVVISILASILFTIFYLRTPAGHRVRRGAVAAIIGGALGNLVDRVFYDGLVVDFIDLGIGSHRFYTFNVADMGVTLGGAVLFVGLWLESRGGAEAEPAAVPGEGVPGEGATLEGATPLPDSDE